MSIGNLKDQGNQGKNFPWQLKMLLGQQCACDELAAINANTDQVEFLLSAILTTLQDGTDYEAKFVVDTCDNNKVYLEVRIWDPTPPPGSWGPITYYIPGSTTPVTPVGEGTPGCLQYTDPSGVLAQILAELQLQTPILTDIELDTTSIASTLTSLFALYSAGPQACADSLSVTLCTEQGNTLSSILTELQSTLDVNVTNTSIQVTQGTTPWAISDNGGSITVDGTVTANQGTSPWVVSGTVNIGTIPEVEIKNDVGNPVPVSGTVAATQSGTWNIASVTGPVALPTGAATETTLGAVNTKLTPAVRTHNTVSATGAGTVPAGSLRGSVLNAGSAAGTWNGISLPAGVAIPWDAVGPRDTYGAIAYNATGTTFIIEYTT